ncbi:SMI1/KNR4 family protein [Thorsellia anophelis]|uniref:Knr4/Smi1-like domain-containing protein n=1 Tax=Thorsellia anophelis DSM 18579 TaxID=1123402 RepID=A0A1I0BLL8_9GAMM|nr:SMI1/KNR4 family protein [Thorsellia anophelis]SET07855.1 hypothetical protein SAMN02583745_01313 [Thorsellia anophelis DSM 18579]
MQQLLLNQTIQTNGTLPQSLLQLILTNKTHYGSPAIWADTWRERLFKNPPALINAWDFEWSSDEEIAENLIWLNPTTQAGLIFLPFGQTGAGDAYCLMPLDNNPNTPLHTWGVALIYHDDEYSKFISSSFSDFLYQNLMHCLADTSSYIDSEISPEEAKLAVLTDIESILESVLTEFSPEQLAILQSIIKELSALRNSVKTQPKRRVYKKKDTYEIISDDKSIPPETYSSLNELKKQYCYISDVEFNAALALAPSPNLDEFKITYRWEI